jgi:hypothetical protein
MLTRSIDVGHGSCIINGKEFSISATFDATSLEGGGTGGINEVQTVTITGTPTGGNITLTFRGATTGNIAFNATADAVETALEALSTIGDGDVRVTGGPGPGTAWIVTFVNDLGHQNVPAMTASGAGLTGGTTPAVTVGQTTAGSSVGFNPRILIGSWDKPGTMVIKVDNGGAGNDRIREYTGTGTIYGLVDGVEEFLGVTSEADRSMPVYGLQAGLVIDADFIKNYSTYKSAIDTWAAAHGVTIRHP